MTPANPSAAPGRETLFFWVKTSGAFYSQICAPSWRTGQRGAAARWDAHHDPSETNALVDLCRAFSWRSKRRFLFFDSVFQFS